MQMHYLFGSFEHKNTIISAFDLEQLWDDKPFGKFSENMLKRLVLVFGERQFLKVDWDVTTYKYIICL